MMMETRGDYHEDDDDKDVLVLPRPRWKYIVLIVLGVTAAVLVVVVGVLAAKYQQTINERPGEDAVRFGGFTARVGSNSELTPWCIETLYSISYVNGGFEGPWSVYSNRQPPIVSVFETLPLIQLQPRPDPAWETRVRRVEINPETGQPENETVIEVQWQNPEQTRFIDRNNPCPVSYVPPRAPAPEPVLGQPFFVDQDGASWANMAGQSPWCWSTKYRAFYVGFLTSDGPWSPWSDVSWLSLTYTTPVFFVRPDPVQTDLQMYWAPSQVEFPFGSRTAFTVVRTSGSIDTGTLWPPRLGERTTVEYALQWISQDFRRVGANVELVAQWNADQETELRVLAVFHDSGSAPDILSVNIPFLSDNVLVFMGFSTQQTRQTIVKGQSVLGLRPVQLYWTKQRLLSSAGSGFRAQPGEPIRDTNNICQGVIPSQPAPPTFPAGGFALNLSNPDARAPT